MDNPSMAIPKITVPFREKQEVNALIAAGADELYCGYLPAAWKNRYTGLEFERKGIGSNFTNLKQLKQAVELAHNRQTPVFLTLNGLYVYSQYPVLLKIVKQLEQLELDAFIVADLGLLLALRRMGTPKQIHISTGGTVFNSQAVDFYQGLGASRIILDRQMSLEAIRELSAAHPGVGFEAFIFTTLCAFIDGYCTFLHTYGADSVEQIAQKRCREAGRLQIGTTYDQPGAQGDVCKLKFSVQTFNSKLNKKTDLSYIKPVFYKQLADNIECGACALYDIAQTRVKSVKIIGRQFLPEERLRDLRFIYSALDVLRKNKHTPRQEFIRQVQQLYRQTFKAKGRCRGNNCYHPEVLLGRAGTVHK